MYVFKSEVSFVSDQSVLCVCVCVFLKSIQLLYMFGKFSHFTFKVIIDYYVFTTVLLLAVSSKFHNSSSLFYYI